MKKREVMKRVTQTAESEKETQHDDGERHSKAEGARMKGNGQKAKPVRTKNTRQRAR